MGMYGKIDMTSAPAHIRQVHPAGGAKAGSRQVADGLRPARTETFNMPVDEMYP
jgi:hypothetical protein